MPSTPPRSTVPLGATLPSVTDTPSKSKQVVSAPILLGNKIDDSRDALLSDIGPAVPQVTIQWFKDSIMPPLPAGLDMPAVIKRLKAEKCITPEGVLAQFTTVPANARDHEDDVFKPLTSLAANMGNIAEEFLGEKPTVLFQCNSTRAPESRRKNSTRPDGYGRYTAHPCHKKSNRQVFWAEIVAPGEFKKVKNAKNTNDNIAKILWSFNHILREDPCRRFVIGFTIENTEMRLWFGSRTDVLVTEAFDFTRDHTTLAHFFLSQMYAKDDELGYDLTMKLAKDQTKYKNQYDITIHHLALGSGGADSDLIDVSKTKPVVLRTEKLISDIGAEALRSRGTRVWHARVLTGELKGTLMVIKDYWVDHDRLREPEIRARILADAQTEEDKATLEQHLLTPQYFGDVVIRGKRDNTLTLLRRGAVVPTDMTYLTIHNSGSGLLSDILEDRPGAPLGTGTIMAAPSQTPKPVFFHDKSHTRIAFLERAVTVDHIRPLGFVLRLAVQTLKALRAMHRSGWVHRDISSGNLLVAVGVVKISDLEYAKRMDDPTTHEHGRSPGTPMFQSIEAQSHKYKFLDRQLRPPGEWAGNTTSVPASSPPLFRYNPLHDLESLWWLLVWLLLVRKANIDGDTEQRRQDQFRFYDRLYRDDKELRREAFSEAMSFDQGAVNLHDRLMPIASLLEAMRNGLVWTYVQAESKDPTKIDHTVGVDVTDQMIRNLERAVEMFTGVADIQYLRDVKVRRKRTPEQPGPAVAYGTSLDSRVEGSSNKRGYHAIADSTVVDNDALWKAADDVKVKRAKQDEEEREKEAVDAHGDGVGAAGKGNGENRGRSRSKGKGKGRARAA